MSPGRQLVLPIFCAIAGFLILQIPAAGNSFLGSPDREMLGMGMKLRRNIVGGAADPVVWIRIDDAALREFSANASGPPPLTVPRSLIARTLRFLRNSAANDGETEAPPASVIVDVDLSWPAESPDATQELHQELAAWAADPAAPTLILARERLSMDRTLRPFNGVIGSLASTPYDDVVQFPLASGGTGADSRILWAGTDVSIDGAARARDLVLGRCLLTPQGRTFLPSAAFLAAHARTAVADGKSLAEFARNRFAQAAAECASAKADAPESSLSLSLISYHFDAGGGEETPLVASSWPGAARCGQRHVLTIYAAGDIAAAGAAGAPRMGVCGSMVIIGAQNSVSTDSYVTPYGPMSGSLVLANAARGLSMVGEMNTVERQWMRWIAQLTLVILTVIAAMMLFKSITKYRLRVIAKTKEAGVKPTFVQSALLFILNPVTVKWGVAIGAFWVGATATAVGLSIGIWGVLAAPVYAAALSETIREYANDS